MNAQFQPETETKRTSTCRYCGETIVLGKHGWRLPHIPGIQTVDLHACPTAPRKYHGQTRETVTA